MPREFQGWMARCRELHPGWRFRLWTNHDVGRFVMAPMIDAARKPAQKADIMRLEILHRHGGIYIDADTEVLRPFDPLLDAEAFAGLQHEEKRYLSTTPMGATPGSAFFAKTMELLPTREINGNIVAQTANDFVTSVHLDHPELPLTVHPKYRFCPYLWWESPPLAYSPETYCAHHWAKSWA